MRTTNEALRSLIDAANRAAGTPVESWTFGEDGKYYPNPGNFHLDYAYGGVRVEQHLKEGGVTVPLSSAYKTKREQADELRAFIAGLRFKK